MNICIYIYIYVYIYIYIHIHLVSRRTAERQLLASGGQRRHGGVGAGPSDGCARRKATFQTLLPTPYNLHPSPFTICPTSCTLDPRPFSQLYLIYFMTISTLDQKSDNRNHNPEDRMTRGCWCWAARRLRSSKGNPPHYSHLYLVSFLKILNQKSENVNQNPEARTPRGCGRS